MYSEWQQSNVLDEDWKKDIQIACNVALCQRLDLELIHAAQESKLFEEEGVKRGVAWRFVQDIPRWAKRQKQSHSVELD
jgi:hypothetical protein